MTPHYRPGRMPSIVARDALVVVDADPATAMRVWEIVRVDTWTPMDVIEVLSADGLAKTPDFAVASLRSDVLTVLVRGAAGAVVRQSGEVDRIDGRSVVTWAERTFTWDGTGSVVLRSDEASGAWLPILAGVVATAEVCLGTPPGTEPKPELEPEVEHEPESELESMLGSEPEVEPTKALELPPEPSAGADVPVDPVVEAPVGSDPNETLADVDESRFDAMFGATVTGRRLEDAAVRESAEPPAIQAPPPPAPRSATPVVGDHGGDTITAAEAARLRREAQAAAPGVASPPPQSVSRLTATVTFSTGRSVTLERPVVIGRAPRTHGATGAQLPQTVVIDNPYVSSTHLLLSVEDDVVMVTDLSTNGTLLTRDGAEPVRLDKGRATIASDGCVLTLSDDITARVSVTREGVA